MWTALGSSGPTAYQSQNAQGGESRVARRTEARGRGAGGRQRHPDEVGEGQGAPRGVRAADGVLPHPGRACARRIAGGGGGGPPGEERRGGAVAAVPRRSAP